MSEPQDEVPSVPMVPTITTMEINEPDLIILSTQKERSVVWKKFKKDTRDGKLYAVCIACGKWLVGGSRKGTSHLINHLKICPRRDVRDIHQQMLSITKNVQEKTLRIKNFKFDQARSRLDLARAIVKHEYPFMTVEHEFFRIFLENLQPMFNVVSRNTIKNDIMSLYESEKKKIYNRLDKITSRVSFTTDMWTSDQHDGYLCLTAHFIDDEWKLHKKILSFVMVGESPDAEVLFNVISKCLLDWNLDKKLSTVTLDNCTVNDSMITKLKTWLGNDKPLWLDGNLLHVRCCAHILNLIVQDGLQVIKDMIIKVRDSVKYVRASASRKLKFQQAISQVKLQTKRGVCFDVDTRWNSTYLMLDVALEYKDAFARLALIDKKDYKSSPSQEEWATAKIICDCLKPFYHATNLFSGTKYPTANIYFPEICEILLKITEWCKSDDVKIKKMADDMKVKFDKYWSKCNIVLSICVILDPRFKMKLVEYYYYRIYGAHEVELHIARIRNGLSSIYSEYASVGSSFTQANESSRAESTSVSNNVDKFVGFDSWCNYESPSFVQKSELELYLDEPIFPRVTDFDILNWWSANSPKYPTLSKMVRDILSIPITSVASESAFSTGGRILDQYRSSLLPSTVEALICGQDWIEREPEAANSVPISMDTDLPT